MSKWRTLTAEQLEAADACPDQVELFRGRFGESVRVTEAQAAKVSGLFDWDWAATRLLSAPARAEYKRVEAQARAEYERVTAPAWAEYERVKAPAWAEYERVTAPAWAEYKRVEAQAWAVAYINDREDA
jgi:cell division septum initiation protein DivIVA